jgi:hypothetical protein
MAKLTDEGIQEALAAHIQEGETLKHWGFGVKQPNMLLIIGLFCLAILPGAIAVAILTKNYLIGLTDRRFIVFQVKSMGNLDVKEITDYGLDEVRSMDVKTSTGALFTHISIKDGEKPFKAKFHRAGFKGNREHSMAIAEAIDSSVQS